MERGELSAYERLKSDLLLAGKASMKLRGSSMEPRVHNGDIGTFKKQETYEIDDIVFCKVGGSYRVHKITAKNLRRGYQISNQKGFVNGWTRHIYGKLISTRNPNDRSGKEG